MKKQRCISVLGSTGSIGRQSLDVIARLGLSVAALTANRDVKRMEAQCRQVLPTLAVMMDETAAAELRLRLADTGVRVAAGEEGLLEAACLEGVDTLLTAVVGSVGLRPTLAALRLGRRVALANKETLVCAGELVMATAREYGGEIIPVDSEHSALFQCLQACGDRGEVKRLILTASGGPFFGYTRAQLASVTREEALRHPNWAMGAKISVDSATLMNKGLELIEAMHLYRMPVEKIGIVIHRESIVHSLVEYCDHAMIAQLGVADMRLPIQYALTYPARTEAVAEPLDLLTCPALTFGAPDEEAFPCLTLAKRAAETGGTATAILNAANEAAVGRFLAGSLSFQEIPARVEEALTRIPVCATPTLEDIFAADQAAREVAER